MVTALLVRLMLPQILTVMLSSLQFVLRPATKSLQDQHFMLHCRM